MAKKFDFVSPGVQINEIDQSQVPVETTEDGILLIGRTLKGPALKPVKVKDLDSFIEVFGLPQSGKPGNGVDIWRSGNRYGPTYAAYAAQAHLAAEISPVTFIRLLGENDPEGGPVTPVLKSFEDGRRQAPAKGGCKQGRIFENGHQG